MAIENLAKESDNLTKEFENLTKEAGSKIYWIECIRVFSAFLVVMQHSISGVWTTLPPDTLEWKIVNFVFLLSRTAVPVFFMCSGIGMFAKARTVRSIFQKNIFNLLKVYIAWMLVYGIRDSISLIREGLGSFRTIRNAFLKDIIFGQYHTWFVMTLLGLYLITPLLYEIVKNEKLLAYFLLLSILFTVILPLTGEINGFGRLDAVFETINMRFVTGYVLYYVLGYYLCRAPWAQKLTRRAASALLAASVLAAFIFSSILSAKNGEPLQQVYGEFAPLGLLVNTSVLLYFKTLIGPDRPKKRTAAWIAMLSSCGTGIYLMHPLLLKITAFFPGIICILGGALVWLTALVICALLSQIKKLLLRLPLLSGLRRQ
ncbi:MAG: acyltransferase family protein [Clostridium sp.]|nr:acyltransferase family protein [Clostridium sp.]